MEGRTIEHSALTMSQMINPQQAGRAGVAHGGEIMKLMDTAAGIVAARHGHKDTVTASVEGINFYRPVKVYDLVEVKAFMTYVGRSAMEVRVDVFTEDILQEEKTHALTAYFLMVALDEEGRPTEVPPLILTTDAEREQWEKGKQRHERCKGEIMLGDDDFQVCRESPLL